MSRLSSKKDARFEIKKVKMDCDYRGTIPEPIPPYHSFVCVVGGVGSGKTNLIINMITNPAIYCGQFDNVYVFSPSFQTIKKKLGLPPEHIFKEFSLDKINEIMQEQLMLNDPEFREKGDTEKEECLIILDDCIARIKDRQVAELEQACLNRRHCFTTIILVSQRYNRIPKILRTVASHLIIFNPPNSDKDDVFKEWSNVTKEMFNEICLFVYNEPKQFLFIIKEEPETKKYYKGFNLIRGVEV